jgi:hypothetical protein
MIDPNDITAALAHYEAEADNLRRWMRELLDDATNYRNVCSHYEVDRGHLAQWIRELQLKLAAYEAEERERTERALERP